MKKVLNVICLFLTLIISGCQCSLHTHYYNDYGACVCGDDIAQELVYESEEYISIEHSVDENEIYYYKFKANGEENMDFYIEGENVTFDRLEIRAEGMLQTVAGPKNYSETIYTYDNNLVKDRVYFLKVTYEGEGTIQLILKR